MANFYSPTQQNKANLVQPGSGFTPSAVQPGNSMNQYQQATAIPDPAANTPFAPRRGGGQRPLSPDMMSTIGATSPAHASSGVAPPPNGGEGVLSGPGYNEDWYKTYGQDLMKSPSASEQLFAKGMEGSNPYYDYAQQEAVKAINDASAARLNFNSSYTMKQIGNTVANIRGQQAKGLTDLAGQSDAARVGRYDFSAGAARSAQNSTEDRIRQIMGGTTDLARGRAGLVDNFYTNAGNISNKANMAAIEAALKESGLSAAEIQNLINNALQAGGVVSKFA